MPLLASRGRVAVLSVSADDSSRLRNPENRQYLGAFTNQIASAIERTEFAGEAQWAQLQMETEQMRSSLLSSVSHDLRTPLAVVTGAASSLLEDTIDAATRRELTETILQEAQRLNRLVRNLLDMTRLEAGAVRVNKEWQPLEEVVGCRPQPGGRRARWTPGADGAGCRLAARAFGRGVDPAGLVEPAGERAQVHAGGQPDRDSRPRPGRAA